MAFTKWANKKVKKLKWHDIKLIKLSTAAFILMIAKLWEPILLLDWYWYGLIFILAAMIPMQRIFGK